MDRKVGGPPYSGVSGTSVERFGPSVQSSQSVGASEPGDDNRADSTLLPGLRRALESSRIYSDASSDPPRALSNRKMEVAPPETKLLRTARWPALATSGRLKERAGEPKKNGLLGIWPMSTGYKSVLRQLDSYHGTLGKDMPAKDGEVNRADLLKQVERATTQLTTLRDLASRYLAADSHTRRHQISIFHDQVTHELTALENLASEVRSGGGALHTTKLESLMAFARLGISLDDMAGHLRAGRSPEEARQNAEPAVAALTAKEGALYTRFEIPEMERTRVKYLRDEQRVGPQKTLGSGRFNTTSEAHFDTPAGLRTVVLKPIPTQVGVGYSTGIDLARPRLAMRNLASCDVDDALGFNVLVKTELALVTPRRKQDKELMLAMEPAPGKTGNEVDKSLLCKPAVIQKLLQLQLLDQLCGQVDRHAGNYRVHVDDEGQAIVKGYDNDQCMGHAADHPDSFAFEATTRPGFRGVRLPPVVDEETASALQEISETRLERILAEKLMPGEITAARIRLLDIQQHLTSLRMRGRIVPASQLGEAENLRWFNRHNAYFMRELNDAAY